MADWKKKYDEECEHSISQRNKLLSAISIETERMMGIKNFLCSECIDKFGKYLESLGKIARDGN